MIPTFFRLSLRHDGAKHARLPKYIKVEPEGAAAPDESPTRSPTGPTLPR
jgi:hypothetical protein